MHCRAGVVCEALLVALRAQTEVDRPHLFLVTSLGYYFAEQAVPRRQAFVRSIEGGLVPEPAMLELKAIVPGDGTIRHQHSTQHQPSRSGKQAGKFVQKCAARRASQV